jgi:hypothetical protein
MSTHYFCTTPATIDDPTLVRMEDIVGPTICRRRCLHRNNSPMTVQAMPLALQIIKPAVPSSRRKHLGSNTAAARHTTSSYPQTRVSSIGLAEHALSGVIGLTSARGSTGRLRQRIYRMGQDYRRQVSGDSLFCVFLLLAALIPLCSGKNDNSVL